jgi:phage gp45-like
MWLSRKLSIYQTAQQEGTAADMGVTTIGGEKVAVMSRGEQRDLEVFAPGGVVWQPAAGDTVLVVRGGVGAQESCVAAAETASYAPRDMAPGELYLYSQGGASVYLRADGSIQVTGPVEVTGDVSVTGNVTLAGRTEVQGQLIINGLVCPACNLV